MLPLFHLIQGITGLTAFFLGIKMLLNVNDNQTVKEDLEEVITFIICMIITLL